MAATLIFITGIVLIACERPILGVVCLIIAGLVAL